MQFTHNFKPKIIQRVTAAVTAAVVSLASLSTTALAGVIGNGGGGTNGGGTVGCYAYDYSDSANLSWKIDMYVSTNDNGKIDPANDKIGSSALPWVGAVMYDNFFTGNAYNTVWLSADYTNESRNSLNVIKEPIYSNGIATGEYKWSVPSATKVTKDTTPRYTLTNGMVVGHITNNPIKLPTDAESIKEDNYKTLVQGKIEDNTNLNHILRDINTGLGGKDNNDLSPLYTQIISVTNAVGGLGSQVKARLEAHKDDPNRYDLLLPTNENAIVEWALVAVPVFGWNATRNYPGVSYWEVYVNNVFTLLNTKNSNVYMGFDAYTTALYNETTKKMYSDSKMVEYAVSQGLNPNRKNGLVYQNWYGTDYYYYAYGKLYVEATLGVHLVAQSAYDMHKGYSEFCGVPVAGGKRDSFTSGGLCNNPADYAKYGGITVYKSEIPDDATVYHHICNIKLNIPKNAPDFTIYNYDPKTQTDIITGKVKMTSAVARDMLLGKAIYDTEGKQVQTNLATVSGFLDYCIDNGYAQPGLSK